MWQSMCSVRHIGCHWRNGALPDGTLECRLLWRLKTPVRRAECAIRTACFLGGGWFGGSLSLGWCGACTARGSGATERGPGVLHVGRGFVQYAQPLASRSPPSWSRPTRAGAGVAPTPRSRTHQQPSVHSADISDFAAEATSGNRWNSGVSSRSTTPEQG